VWVTLDTRVADPFNVALLGALERGQQVTRVVGKTRHLATQLREHAFRALVQFAEPVDDSHVVGRVRVVVGDRAPPTSSVCQSVINALSCTLMRSKASWADMNVGLARSTAQVDPYCPSSATLASGARRYFPWASTRRPLFTPSASSFVTVDSGSPRKLDDRARVGVLLDGHTVQDEVLAHGCTCRARPARVPGSGHAPRGA